MSDDMTIEAQQIKLLGRIPSKKNSRISTKSGRTFPSKKYTEWHKDATAQVVKQGVGEILGPVHEVFLMFRLPDNRRCDLTNKAESIMDLLVDCGVIEDDCWQVVPRISLTAAGVDKKNPGVDVLILCEETR